MTIQVSRSCIVDAPIDIVWRLLRDFNSHVDWHPAIALSQIEAGEPSDHVSAVRAFRLKSGGYLREQLIAMSDCDCSLTYCLLEAPLRLDGYVATMRLRRITDGERTFLQWQSRFDAPIEQASALTQLVGETIYEAGMAALRARLGRRPSTSAQPVAVRPQEATRPIERTASSSRPPTVAPMDAAAIVVERHGGPDVLLPRRVPVPPPGPREVRIRHLAIGVNMVDVHGRAGDFGLGPLPAVPGMEAAGIVLDVGPAVTHLKAGDRVVYAGRPPGAYAALRTLPADIAIPLPPDIDARQAAATFLKGVTADLLLHDVHTLREGETILVHAAAGGLGLILCGWARTLGATVIGVVSSDRKVDAAADAGCAAVIVSSREDVAQAVHELTRGRGVDVVFDAIGRDTFETSLGSLASRGHLVSFGQVSGPVGARDIDALAARSIRLSRPNFADYTASREALGARADRLFGVLRSGTIRPRIDSEWPLSRAADAHRRLQSRETIGSVLLLPEDG